MNQITTYKVIAKNVLLMKIPNLTELVSTGYGCCVDVVKVVA